MADPKPYELWRHYKGGLYQIESIGFLEKDKSIHVGYRTAEPEKVGLGEYFGTWYRPLSEWHDIVALSHNPGHNAPRFTYVEPLLTTVFNPGHVLAYQDLLHKVMKAVDARFIKCDGCSGACSCVAKLRSDLRAYVDAFDINVEWGSFEEVMTFLASLERVEREDSRRQTEQPPSTEVLLFAARHSAKADAYRQAMTALVRLRRGEKAT